jgi:hypothetical protein
MHWYVDQVLRLGTTSVWARRRFLEVQGMLKDATSILRPDMLVRVLLNQFRRGSVSNTQHQYLDGREHTHLPEKYRRNSAEVSQEQNTFTETGNIAYARPHPSFRIVGVQGRFVKNVMRLDTLLAEGWEDPQIPA